MNAHVGFDDASIRWNDSFRFKSDNRVAIALPCCSTVFGTALHKKRANLTFAQ
ncbi:MAG: hypothetical protein JWP79_1237 [Polaromonas sp.]|nr:hypothetical protein [Polaromonas sp.]